MKSLIFLVILLSLQIHSNNGLSPFRAANLLAKYGYMDIPPNPVEDPNALMIYGNYREAIKKFQRFNNLPVTGLMSPKVKKLLTAKRCGNPDLDIRYDPFKMRTSTNLSTLIRKKRYLIDDPRWKWKFKTVTWQIRAYPRFFSSHNFVRALFTKAFNLWAKYGDISFKEVNDLSKKADIVIVFGDKGHGDSIPFDGPGGTLAHAFFPGGSMTHEYSIRGDAHFDDSENWGLYGNTSSISLLKVAVHEIGHTMGIGHSRIETAIMYPMYISDGPAVLDLDKDDIAAVQKHYGRAKPNKVPVPLPTYAHTIPMYTRKTTTTTTTRPPYFVEFCDTTVDAIMVVRESEICVFKGMSHWRMRVSRTTNQWVTYELRDGPLSMFTYWNHLPKHLTHVDGAIESVDNKIYIFSGSRFWLLNNDLTVIDSIDKQHGMPLTGLGLPSTITKIDTVFRWGFNNKIYIFAGSVYWKIDETQHPFGWPHDRYPRRISLNWMGLPSRVDAAFTDLNRITYFIKGKYYYIFDNLRMSVEGPRKRLTVPWLGCMKNN